MNKLKSQITNLAVALTLVCPTGLSGIPAPESAGITVDSLLELNSIPISTLIDKTYSNRFASLANPAVPAYVGVPVDELLSAPPMSISELLTFVGNETPKLLVENSKIEVKLAAAAPKADVSKTEATGTKQTELTVMYTDGTLTVTPETLKLAKVGSKAKVTFSGDETSASLFVRDQKLIEWQFEKGLLVAREKGQSEIYVVHGATMLIVPVEVEKAENPYDMTVPEALVSLEGLKSKGSSAKYKTGDDEAVSLRDSREQTETTLRESEKEGSRYRQDQNEVMYTTVSLQIVDERSLPSRGKVYPVRDAVVRIAGTEFSAKTDTTGHLTIKDMPAFSQFMVTVDDPNGQIFPTVAFISTAGEESGGVVRIKASRFEPLENIARMVGVVQNSGLASMCGVLIDSEHENRPVIDVSASINAEAERVVYFNQYGFADGAQNKTGADGRFCFFNISPGPVSLSFSDEDGAFASISTAAFSGRHTERDLDISKTQQIETRLASLSTAHEQLGSDTGVANSYRTIDMADVVPFGTGDLMMQLEPGLVKMSSDAISFDGRMMALAETAEFESTVYTYREGEVSVTPLIPRGFVEDMSLYAQVVHDPVAGVVLVEYGRQDQDFDQAINIKLVDESGRSVGDGWYFNDNPVTKAIFFNTPPGKYSVLVKTSERYWLAAETVVVYNETISYVRAGNPVRYRP